MAAVQHLNASQPPPGDWNFHPQRVGGRPVANSGRGGDWELFFSLHSAVTH